MITRGYFIGGIIDALSSHSQQVTLRGKLGLFDLNIYLENYFCNILNLTLDKSLSNLNEEKSTYPGLDLLDDSEEGFGVQVTSQKTSSKAKNTLRKICKYIENPPKEIIILIIGEPQNSYSLKKKHQKKLNFKKSNIWGMTKLCKKIMGLDIKRLEELYKYIEMEAVKVKIELEIPNKKGEYDTKAEDHFEKIPKERFSNVKKYYDFQKQKQPEFEHSYDEVLNDFKCFIFFLKSLPRITRELLSKLIDRRDVDKDDGECIFINYNLLERIWTYSDKQGEISLLSDTNVISIIEPDDSLSSPFYRLQFKHLISFELNSDYFISELIDYSESENINLYNVFSSLDFSKFSK